MLVAFGASRLLTGDGDPARPLARAAAVTALAQLAAGFVNVILLAPIWMQVLHLLLADLLWIASVLLAARVLARDRIRAPFETAPA